MTVENGFSFSGLKERYVTIVQDGRDKGKVFKITEMPAIMADKWAQRTMLELIRSGHNIPDDIRKMGILAVVAFDTHMLRGVRWEEYDSLLDQMMDRVEILPTPSQRDITRKITVDDILERSTLETLRLQLYKIHVDFGEPAGS
jgi:hypothetical protein